MKQLMISIGMMACSMMSATTTAIASETASIDLGQVHIESTKTMRLYKEAPKYL